MSNLENALRRALSKGDSTDPQFRRKVYTAAASAMERSMADGGVDEATKAARRKNLAAVISSLESEVRIVPKQMPADSPDIRHEPSSGAPQHADTRLRVEPRLDEPGVSASEAPTMTADADRRPARPKTRFFSKMLSVVVLLAIITIGAIWVFTTGAFQSAQERDTSVPNPPLLLEDESSTDNTGSAPALATGGTADERAEAEGWITLFSPSDPTSLGLADGAEASIRSDPFGDFARIVTPNATSEVQVDVPVGTLLALQGFPVQVNIVARSDEGLPTEFSVTCDLGALGDCGRRRFNVGQAPAEYLFRINLPSVDEIQGGGILKIRTDINGNERPLNLLAVRIRRAGDN
ncbi:MAG: hypothetical protein WA921_03035 [Ahrensia sp.]